MNPRTLALVVAVGCSFGGTAASATNLKLFDPVALRDTVETTAKELMLPGAMVLLRTPRGEFVFGYGTTELGGTTPPRADTHFRIASNTKTMTAAVIVLLAQEGKLRFDDPVSKYVSGVPNGDNITISQLLKMRSGLFNYTSAPELAESLDHDPARGLDHGRTACHRIQASARLHSGNGIRLLQHQLCAARSRRRKD
jgi:D-alanyl-D-alanine carboxypeptidase